MWVELFEAFMLICFGSAWPFAIAKSLQCRLADGKSPLFLVIIFTGYISGICARFLAGVFTGRIPLWVECHHGGN